jgi:phospholipase C
MRSKIWPLVLSSSLLLYAVTITSCGGSAAAATPSPTAPNILSFTASSSTIAAGQLSTLTWTTSNAQSVSISPDPTPGNSESSGLALSGTVSVSPTATTTYTLTATGTDKQTTTASVTVTVSPMKLDFSVNPPAINAGSPITLSWQTSGGVTNLAIDNNVCAACALPSGSVVINPGPGTTTTYTATATGPGGAITQSVVLTVSPAPPGNPLKHIVFMLQENRSFDDYFGMLGPYRAQRLAQFGITASASDVNGLNCADSTCSNITLYTRNDAPIPDAAVHPFHYTTACTENLSPSWDESHYDVDLNGTSWSATTQPGWTADPSAFKMDNFLQTTTSITQTNPNDDPSGTRPMGYYTDADLPFYYDLATFFATSDTWFSPMLANTIPNRMYIMAATSFGHVFPDPPPSGGFSPETIFGALTKAGVSWRYYYQDNSVFLAQFHDYQSNPAVRANVAPIQDYYDLLHGNCGGQSCDADQALPQVVFIERAASTALDEHPDTGTNNQKGAAQVRNIIAALMDSTAWKHSAFIFSFDEAGGLYDHVPPMQVPVPDGFAPGHCPDSGPCTFSSSDAQATFNLSGMRLPLIVISPWVRPHFVSHVPRDSTAILAFIENTFNVPPLTKRDAYFTDPSRDMSEFFDFSTPALLNAPDGSPWSSFLPQQPTNLPCDPSLGKAPGF